VDSSQEEQSSLSSYVDLVDSFREIHRRTWPNSPALVSILCFLYFFGGLEWVGRSFAYVAHFVFLRDVWIRTQASYQISHSSIST
jgi:hypothetical protein